MLFSCPQTESERHLRFSPLVKYFSKYLTDLHNGEWQLTEIRLRAVRMLYNQFIHPSKPSTQEVDSLLPEYAGKSQSKQESAPGRGGPTLLKTIWSSTEGITQAPRNPQGGVTGTKFLTIVCPKNRAERNANSPLTQSCNVTSFMQYQCSATL